MAVRYAVATGNWSNTATWNGGTLPTASDDVYSNNFVVTINQDVTVLSIRNTAQSPAVAGGGFLLTGTFTVNATGVGLLVGGSTLLTYTGSNSVINGIVTGSATANFNAILHNSTGALTINGNIVNTSNPAVDVIRTASTGALNINGNILGNGRGNNILVASICTVTIVGDVIRNSNFSGGAAIPINANATVNITGNVSNTSIGSGSPTITINATGCFLNVTGNVFHNSTTSTNDAILFIQAGSVNITGSVYTLLPLSNAIRSTVAGYLKIVGPVYTTVSQNAVSSTNLGAINLFSGPFTCSTYGFMPFVVARMNYIITSGSYFEFRDSSTNGALAPSPSAPATRLVSPDTIVDSPIPANVRQGVTYALGSFTGTLAVPAPGSVALGVATDNTVGTAVLTPAAVWSYATASITDPNSIGARVKNTSTVDTTGSQLTAFLNA